MRIVTLRRLRGPNIYCWQPAVLALVDLEELAGRETCVVILSGTADVEAGDARFGGIGGRASVFDEGAPGAVYVPAGLSIAITATTDVEAAICTAPGSGAGTPRLITAEQMSRVLMCVHNWKHAPAYRRAKELVAAGRLGDVSYVSLTRLRAEAAGQSGKVASSGEEVSSDAGAVPVS